ncbi:unnamed protein product [Acanthosepion pharaonis]|uniref:Uncharacterized protein n=1 Tax=Acanthosepion pharaonis TaxID=158019 RepID=A0A812CKM7_ACAPH|nr:unnamed protein product [Sepia pharaonis]
MQTDGLLPLSESTDSNSEEDDTENANDRQNIKRSSTATESILSTSTKECSSKAPPHTVLYESSSSTEIASKTIERPTITTRQPWLSGNTSHNVEYRRALRCNDILEYRRLNIARYISFKANSEPYLDNEAAKLENQTRRNDHSLIYCLLRSACCGPQKKVTHIWPRDGVIIVALPTGVSTSSNPSNVSAQPQFLQCRRHHHRLQQ